MRRLLIAIVVAAAAVVGLSPAQAGASAQMLGPSQNVCANAPIPTGWIPTAYFDWYQCGQPGTIYYNAKTIKDVTDTSAGGTVTGCITPPPPAGFYATALSYSYDCEISKTPNGVLNNQQTLTNLNGLPSGRTLVICGVQSAPPGWTVVSVVRSYLCVYARGGGVGDNAVSIRKL
ncbi:hypothetical protein [Nonomuraea candida]|uniref:hypothetical protein n=1 Tax=Nonomuraea candida TaxID=359159 RepID=UPI0005B95B8A|nr:hypothetical protein [Nonomuraea candida]